MIYHCYFITYDTNEIGTSFSFDCFSLPVYYTLLIFLSYFSAYIQNNMLNYIRQAPCSVTCNGKT